MRSAKPHQSAGAFMSKPIRRDRIATDNQRRQELSFNTGGYDARWKREELRQAAAYRQTQPVGRCVALDEKRHRRRMRWPRHRHESAFRRIIAFNRELR